MKLSRNAKYEKAKKAKDLFPSMYRDINTGVMGNKSLH